MHTVAVGSSHPIGKNRTRVMTHEVDWFIEFVEFGDQPLDILILRGLEPIGTRTSESWKSQGYRFGINMRPDLVPQDGCLRDSTAQRRSFVDPIVPHRVFTLGEAVKRGSHSLTYLAVAGTIWLSGVGLFNGVRRWSPRSPRILRRNFISLLLFFLRRSV